MRTIGKQLQTARKKKSLSLEELSQLTKINKSYLKALESDSYSNLPSAAFVKSFIQTVSIVLDIDPKTSLALLRRDFDQDPQGNIVPRGFVEPIVQKTNLFHPKTTSLIIFSLMVILIGSFFFFQLRSLHQPPTLIVSHPQPQGVYPQTFEVSGKTSSDATLKINNQPTSLKPDGSFQTSFTLDPGEHTLVVTAESRDGKTTTIPIKITVSPDN